MKLQASLVSVLLAVATLNCEAQATNLSYTPSLTDSDVQYYLSHPNLAAAYRYHLTDSTGNTMDVPSIIQMSGQSYKYAAVYHNQYSAADGKNRFKVNLAVSNDLLNWTYVGVLADNSSMARIGTVAGSTWIVVAREQWYGSGTASSAPQRVGYQLFYNFSDLLSLTTRSAYDQPRYRSDYNGTPSFYEMHIAKYGNYYSVDGQYGFHFKNGRDVNAVTTTLRMFDPSTSAQNSPSTADAYNNRFISQGVSGNIGQRDTLITTTARYNIQEGNVGTPGASFDKWRIYLYKFGDSNLYPTGNGYITSISPITIGGSTSFGNPCVTVVDNPSGTGKVIVISYFLFNEGAAPGEAGNLLYYFPLP